MESCEGVMDNGCEETVTYACEWPKLHDTLEGNINLKLKYSSNQTAGKHLQYLGNNPTKLHIWDVRGLSMTYMYMYVCTH